MTLAHVWFISADRWSCPDCERTIHRWLRESDDAWAARLRYTQKYHGRAHKAAVPR